MSATFIAGQNYDLQNARQYLNEEGIVFHCHHYTTLFTQLADDAESFGGPKLLTEAAEECFYNVLVRYFKENAIDTIEERISIAEQYYSFAGLGQLKIDFGQNTAEMVHSHVDEGWIKKWSKRNKPVNFIGQGYIAAVFSAINGTDIGVFCVQETQSIVSGSEDSKFIITKK